MVAEFATTFFFLCHPREGGDPENVEMTREMFYIKKLDPRSGSRMTEKEKNWIPSQAEDDRKENIPIMPPRLAVCHCEERSDAATPSRGGKINGRIRDCFATLAMTGNTRSNRQRHRESPWIPNRVWDDRIRKELDPRLREDDRSEALYLDIGYSVLGVGYSLFIACRATTMATRPCGSSLRYDETTPCFHATQHRG